MAIVTISHQFGSGGSDIAECVAQRLSYRCVGTEMLADAAHQYGLAEERLTQLGEAKPPLLDRLAAETRVYIAVMQAAVYAAALGDDAVIVGRGGQWLLRGIPHVLRVRVIAPFDVRVRRLSERLASRAGRAADLPAAHAAVSGLVRHDDADKAGRMRFLYQQAIDDHELYDLVVNTEAGDMDGIVAALALLARQPARATTPESTQRVADLALASRVRIALLRDDETRHYAHPEVEAEAGVVRVLSHAPAALVTRVARGVEGVVDVKVDEIPAIPPMPTM